MAAPVPPTMALFCGCSHARPVPQRSLTLLLPRGQGSAGSTKSQVGLVPLMQRR